VRIWHNFGNRGLVAVNKLRFSGLFFVVPKSERCLNSSIRAAVVILTLRCRRLLDCSSGQHAGTSCAWGRWNLWLYHNHTRGLVTVHTSSLWIARYGSHTGTCLWAISEGRQSLSLESFVTVLLHIRSVICVPKVSK